MWFWRFGGAGREGVGGGGAEGGSRDVGVRLRGVSLGSLALRVGASGCMDSGCVIVMGDAVGCRLVDCVECLVFWDAGMLGRWKVRVGCEPAKRHLEIVTNGVFWYVGFFYLGTIF